MTKNEELLTKYRKKYPFEVLVAAKLSPVQYQNMNPKVKFAFVPLPEGRYWLFQNEIDLNKFKSDMSIVP